MTKITSDHLARAAYVYVRQSTADQLLHNHESRRRQYGLADRARQSGLEGGCRHRRRSRPFGRGVSAAWLSSGFWRRSAKVGSARWFAIEASRWPATAGTGTR